MSILIRIAGILVALIVVSALARHVLPLLRSGDVQVPVAVPVTSPAEAQVTIDKARQDIEAAAKLAADRAAAADR
jgi:hypothetical protein